MVFFSDKVGSLHSTTVPETFLSSRAILRRTKQNISMVEEDLPVVQAYVARIQNEGVTVVYSTKWLNGVLVECSNAQLATLEVLPFVISVEFVAPGGRPPGGRIKSMGKFKGYSERQAESDIQLSMLGIDAMHNAGYRGEGMLIAILDAGFPGADTISFFKHVFNEGRFDAITSYDFVSGGSNVFRHHNHGTNVWSTIAAFKNGQFSGGAYKANFILFVTEDSDTEFRVEEYNWLFAAEKADSAGVDIISTSLGYTTFDDSSMDYSASNLDGQTTVITRAAEIAASKGMAVVASAGNAGQGSPTTIGGPADGENVLAVGSVTSASTISSFSSIGPSADGRIKPDVVAMGSSVSVISANGFLTSLSGTSFAAPLTTSLIAGLWQMLPDLTAKELLDTIRGRASQASNPDNLLGYGIPNFNYLVTTINEDMLNDFVSVFPNPVSDQINIEFNDAFRTGTLNFSLFTPEGVTIDVGIHSAGTTGFLIELTNQPCGLYLLRYDRGKQHAVYKIVKVE